jgi:hypothetical protein
MQTLFFSVVEILKDVLLVSNGLPSQFNLHSSSGVDDLVWFIEGSKKFVHYAENDEFIVGCHVDECVFDPSHFDPPKVDLNVIGHFLTFTFL